MDLTKNKGKKSLFMCFKSIGLNTRKDPLRRSMSENNFALSDDNDNDNAIVKKEKPRRRLSRVLKAVLFDASLSKRLRTKKRALSSFASHNNLSSIQPLDGSSNNRELSESDDASAFDPSPPSSQYSSTSNMTFLCPNCSCSVCPSPERKAVSNNTNPVGKRSMLFFGSYCNTTRTLCLLISAIMVLFFWGKICALCCTITWILFAPRRYNVVDSPSNVFESRDFDRF